MALKCGKWRKHGATWEKKCRCSSDWRFSPYAHAHRLLSGGWDAYVAGTRHGIRSHFDSLVDARKWLNRKLRAVGKECD